MIKKSLILFLSSIICFSATSCSSQSTDQKHDLEYDADGMPVGLDPWAKKVALQHRESVKRIDQSYDERARGRMLFQSGDYEQALIHYLKARELTVGPKGVISRLIAETYQKLGRYDEAIATLQESIDTNQWNEEGKADTRALIDQYQNERNK